MEAPALPSGTISLWDALRPLAPARTTMPPFKRPLGDAAMRVVTLEEHYTVPSLVRRISPEAIARRGFVPRKVPPGKVNPLDLLPEIGEARLRSVGHTGITG